MKKLLVALICVLAVSFTSCFTTKHTVGSGVSSGLTVTERQWYALWGLLPIKQADSKAMAAGAKNYTITTEFTLVDVIISAITGIATVVTNSVTVQK